MLKRLRLKHFKQFEDEVFDISGNIVLAGPNNSGKTSLLQAITAWRLALDRWIIDHPQGSQATKRAAMPITRKDFTALPLRAMNLLWTDCSVSLSKKENPEKSGHPKYLEICLEGEENGQPWEFPVFFRYGNREMLYVKPSDAYLSEIPDFIQNLSVIHVPPFSGIGAEETRYDKPYQDLLIGQGKAGDVIRNLLLEIYESDDKSRWEALCGDVEDIFGYRLLPPEYGGSPYILCEYLKGIPKGRGKNGLPQLDIAAAGSGFHQVLLLLGFLYARPSSVLLLDEPDAHLHVILQKQIYDRLRAIAIERSCQMMVATHSEVLIDGTSPADIISFCGDPHRLTHESERDRIRESLKRINAMEILLAENAKGVLYLEGESDFNLLKAWAEVLEHPLCEWFKQRPFWKPIMGSHPRMAREHFYAMKSIKNGMHGCLLLDSDNKNTPDREVTEEGLQVVRWKRYESESYLVHPQVLERFVGKHWGPVFSEKVGAFLQDRMPPIVFRDPLREDDYWATTAVSKTLLPSLFSEVGMNLSKQEYYFIALEMEKDEISAEVGEILDHIHKAVGA